MDAELNKIMGAVLGTLTFAMGLNIASAIIFTPKKPAIPGYDLPVPEPAAPAAGSDQQAQAVPLPVLLASADAGKGESAAKKCAACHSFDKGGANKIGPNLYGVVGRAKGGHPGFAYSTALKGKGGAWTYEDLDGFLANPKGWLPGTIMAFQGVSNPKERADIGSYLQKLAEAPVAFPAPPPVDATVQPAAAPGPSQTEQRSSPAMPGQGVEPGPAPLQAQPQSAGPQTQPAAQSQPTPTQAPPGNSGASAPGTSPGAGTPAPAPAQR